MIHNTTFTVGSVVFADEWGDMLWIVLELNESVNELGVVYAVIQCGNTIMNCPTSGLALA